MQAELRILKGAKNQLEFAADKGQWLEAEEAAARSCVEESTGQCATAGPQASLLLSRQEASAASAEALGDETRRLGQELEEAREELSEHTREALCAELYAARTQRGQFEVIAELEGAFEVWFVLTISSPAAFRSP